MLELSCNTNLSTSDAGIAFTSRVRIGSRLLVRAEKILEDITALVLKVMCLVVNQAFSYCMHKHLAISFVFVWKLYHNCDWSGNLLRA